MTDVSITSTGINYAASATPGWISNLQLYKTGNVLTVCGLGSVALSATNPGFVCAPTATAGVWQSLKITANATLEDDAGSEQILGRWGTSASVAWGNALPFFLYVVNNAGTGYFSISRDPRATSLPSNGNNIGDSAAAPAASAQSNHVIMANITPADFASLPCLCIGSFTMTCDSSAGGKWTVGAFTQADGIGRFQEARIFTMPAGQNGAITQGGTATHLYVAGGDGVTDVPTWATGQGQHQYMLTRDGEISGVFDTTGYGNCTNGDVNAQLYLILPAYVDGNWTFAQYVSAGYIAYGAVGSLLTVSYGGLTGGLTLSRELSSTAANGFSNANDDISVEYRYKAY